MPRADACAVASMSMLGDSDSAVTGAPSRMTFAATLHDSCLLLADEAGQGHDLAGGISPTLSRLNDHRVHKVQQQSSRHVVHVMWTTDLVGGGGWDVPHAQGAVHRG